MVGTNLRPVLRLLIASAVALLGIALSVPVAAAEPCSVLDLSCVVDQTSGTVGDTVDETAGTVGDTVEQTGGTVGGVVGGTLGDTVEQVTETMGGALDQVSGTVGGVLSGVGPTGGTTTTDPGGQTGGAPGGGGGGTQPPAGGGSGVPSTAGMAGPADQASIRSGNGSASPSQGPTVRDPRTGLGSTLSLAQTVAFPLTLILIVLGFLSVQDRIDRKDPKLALAPVGSDYLTFS